MCITFKLHIHNIIDSRTNRKYVFFRDNIQQHSTFLFTPDHDYDRVKYKIR